MLVVQSLNLRHWWFWWLSHRFLWFMFKLFYILHQKLENILHLKICYNEIRVQILHPQNFFQDDLFVEMLVFMVFTKTKVRFGYRWNGVWVFYVFSFFPGCASGTVYCPWTVILDLWTVKKKKREWIVIFHTFKNYFATMFSVFNKISCIQMDFKQSVRHRKF